MRRVVMGIVWFLVIQFFLGSIVVLVFWEIYPGATRQQSIDTLAKTEIIPIVLIVSLLLAILGTATGKLPGTRRK